jgi:hypothetical protein
MSKSKKIANGKYEYKGYAITNHGYYPPDHHVWWEAVNMETGCADYHAQTKKEIMDLIDFYEHHARYMTKPITLTQTVKDVENKIVIK